VSNFLVQLMLCIYAICFSRFQWLLSAEGRITCNFLYNRFYKICGFIKFRFWGLQPSSPLPLGWALVSDWPFWFSSLNLVFLEISVKSRWGHPRPLPSYKLVKIPPSTVHNYTSIYRNYFAQGIVRQVISVGQIFYKEDVVVLYNLYSVSVWKSGKSSWYSNRAARWMIRDSISGMGKRVSQTCRPVLRHTEAYIQLILQDSLSRCKAAGAWSSQLTLSITGVKNEWSYTSMYPQYVYMAWTKTTLLFRISFTGAC
jgi:hypothetical protein